MARLLTTLYGGRFEVDNPFLWETKARLVRHVADAGCADLIALTNSCSRPWAMRGGRGHCGVCSQCLGRRFAVAAAGQEAADPAADYEFDPLTAVLPERGHARAMLAVYLETANRVARMGAGEFFSRHGEATRVLNHTEDTASEAAAGLFGLYTRHAAEVNGVVEGLIAARAAAILRRDVADGTLLQMVLPAAPPAAPAAPRPENGFRRKGRGWEVWFRGGKDFILLPHRGVAYLHLLLSNPGRWHTAAQLACLVAGEPLPRPSGRAGETIDAQARTAYLVRLAELKEELEEARADEDEEAEAGAMRDMAMLMQQVKQAAGRRGRTRANKSDRDRIRGAVCVAVRRALKEIAGEDAALAEHLREPRLQLGADLRYQPDPGVDWECG